MFMLNSEYPAEVRIRIMAGQVYASSELGMWCFSTSGELYYSTCPNDKEILSLLQLNGCLDYLIGRESGWDKPVILSDSLGMVFIGETIYKEEDSSEDQNREMRMHILVGPFFLNSSSVKEIERGLRKKISSIKAQRVFLRILQTVPVLHISALDIYASMLHYTINDELIQSTEYYHQIDPAKKASAFDLGLEEEDDEPFATNEDRETDMEQRILQAIREGNAQIRTVMKNASSGSTGLVTMSGNHLRDGKNTLIVLNALSARAAIDGGVPLASSRTSERYFFEQIEACETISELHSMSNELIDTYIHKVQESKANEQISKGIRECCDYIRANVQKELTIENLAERIGYTQYYFTKKFNKEMGVRVIDFINVARIDYAKILLISTNRSIQDISDSLHFGTRNYFSKVFREVTGITPAKYREQGSQEKID